MVLNKQSFIEKPKNEHNDETNYDACSDGEIKSKVIFVDYDVTGQFTQADFFYKWPKYTNY
ncbi:hypothetical protein Lpar_2323 [Legionella parisiensis]|nr:hypothetical protein Lpar_2323 [Legionella parisiensis]STX76702.1 Uncharacterised protein [Legionella parisiensis]